MQTHELLYTRVRTIDAGECIRCASCEECCPFGVPIMENMERAAGVFGALKPEKL